MDLATRLRYAFGLAVLLSLFGCTTVEIAPTPLPPPQSLPTPQVTMAQTQGTWQLSATPTGTNGESSLAVHFLVLDEQRLTIVYSFAGDAALRNEFFNKLYLTGGTDQKYPPAYASLLIESGNLQIGSLTFEKLPPQLHKFALVFEPTTNNPLAVDVASVVPPTGAPPTMQGQQYTMARKGVFVQSGYALTFSGFSLNPDKPLQANEAAAITQALAKGEAIASEATLRLETIESGSVQYLYVVIFRNGEVRGQVLD